MPKNLNRRYIKVLHSNRFYILGDGGATKGSAEDAASDSGTAKSAK